MYGGATNQTGNIYQFLVLATGGEQNITPGASRRSIYTLNWASQPICATFFPSHLLDDEDQAYNDIPNSTNYRALDSCQSSRVSSNVGETKMEANPDVLVLQLRALVENPETFASGSQRQEIMKLSRQAATLLEDPFEMFQRLVYSVMSTQRPWSRWG